MIDDHFTGGDEGYDASFVCTYLDEENELWSDVNLRDEPDTDLSRWAGDFQIEFAKTLLKAAKSTHRREMLVDSYSAVQDLVNQEYEELETHFDQLGVDWTAGGAGGTPRAKVSMTTGSVQSLL